MSRHTGRNLRLSPFRSLVVDLMHFCKKVPSPTIERSMDLGALVAARKACVPRITWSSIFLKAWGIVAARTPELRCAYMPFPWPHLYEHPINIASYTIERRYQDEDVVFFVQVRSPEKRSLAYLDRLMHRCKTEPVESVKFFKRVIRMSKVPWPFRRLSMWVSLNLFGKLRSHNFGTFSLTSVAGEGAGVVTMPLLLTTTLHYGLFDDRGNLPMRLTFDHRAIDGAIAARSLAALENVLRTELLQELVDTRSIKAA